MITWLKNLVERIKSYRFERRCLSRGICPSCGNRHIKFYPITMTWFCMECASEYQGL